MDEIEANAKELMRIWNSPAIEYLSDLRRRLKQIILPSTDGPFDADGIWTESEFPCYGLDFGDGLKFYRSKHATVPDDVGRAIEAIQQIKIVEIHMGTDGDRNWLLKSSVRLGALCQRILNMNLEEDAQRGRRVIQAATQGGLLNAKLPDGGQQDVAKRVHLLISGGMGQTKACEQCAAEHGNQFSPKTAERYYKKRYGTD